MKDRRRALTRAFTVIACAIVFVACVSGPGDADVEKHPQTDVGTALEGPTLAMENLGRLLEQGETDRAWPVFLTLETPDAQDVDGNTALIMAVGLREQEFASRLLAAGSSTNIARNDGIAPLHLAVFYGSSELARLLLDHGADSNVATAQGTRPLHIAIENNSRELSDLLLRAGADAFASRSDGIRPLDFETSIAADYRELVRSTVLAHGVAAVVPVLRFGPKLGAYAQRYGPTVDQAYEERGADAFKTGVPELAPFPAAEISIPRSFDYLEQPYIDITVENKGRGDLFEIIAQVRVEDGEPLPVFFGWLPPGESAVRRVSMPAPGIQSIGTQVPVRVDFSEANGYDAPSRSGVISIADINNRWIQEHIDRFTTANVRELVRHQFIDRRAIDRLIHFDEIRYTIRDVIFFSSHRSISQDIVERIIREGHVPYTNTDLIRLAENNYVSRELVEELFRVGREFVRTELDTLAGLNVFRRPELLYTYRVRDGGTPTSTGNQDGIIQPLESPDFTFVLRNNSVFPLEDIRVEIVADHPDLILFRNSHVVRTLDGGQTLELTMNPSLLPRFKDDGFELKLSVRNDQFGELLSEVVEVPVGKVIERDTLIAFNKEVVSKASIEVFDGASIETPRISLFPAGARFQVTGALDEYYRVLVGGRPGWVLQNNVQDYVPAAEAEYELASDIADTDTFFFNQRPEIVIRSPRNNDVIDHNRVTLDVRAIDRQHGIHSIAVWVNGNLLPGSAGTRGLVVVGADRHDRSQVDRAFDLSLRRGENTIRVVAYNSNNVESPTEEIIIESTGMRNPPRLFVLAAGVDNYNNPAWNLRYAARDAETIAEIFDTQRNAGLYDEVHTKVLLNDDATREGIIEAMETFVGRAHRHDTVVVFLAGHGVQHRDTYYFMGADANLDTPTRHGLDQDAIQRSLRYNVDTERALVMLDTCQSGFIPGRRDAGPDMTRVIEQLAETQGIVYLSASRGNEAAREDPTWGHGVFTLAVREALLEGRARISPGRRAINVDDLYRYVSARVIELTEGQQRPLLSGSMEFFPLYALEP